MKRLPRHVASSPLDSNALHDHYGHMVVTNIATLKASLSELLAGVKAGEELAEGRFEGGDVGDDHVTIMVMKCVAVKRRRRDVWRRAFHYAQGWRAAGI